MYLIPFKNNDYVLTTIINSLQNLCKKGQRKIITYHTRNQFLNSKQIDCIIEYYGKCINFNVYMRSYIKRFRRKVNSKIKSVNDCDLILENDYKSNEKISVINDNGHKYWFSLNDIKQILTNSIENSIYCVPEPKRPCNPYTKEEFKTSEIIEMIEFLKKDNYSNIVINIYENYIDDTEMMVQMHYLYFCKKAIKKYVDEFEKDEIIDNIIDLSWKFLKIDIIKSIVDSNKTIEELNSLFNQIIKKYYLQRRMNNLNIINKITNEINNDLAQIIYNDINSYNPKLKVRRTVKVKRDRDGVYIGNEPSQRRRIEINSDINQVNNDINQVNNDINQVNNDINQVNNDINQVNNDINQVNNDINQVNNDINQVNNEHEVDEHIGDEGEINTVTSQVINETIINETIELFNENVNLQT